MFSFFSGGLVSFVFLRSWLLFFPLAMSTEAFAVNWKEMPVDAAGQQSASIFAVITKKAGIAAGFAHNHLIEARDYVLKVLATEATLTPAEVSLVIPVTSLAVDDPLAIDSASKRLTELGVSHAVFSKLSDGDRKTIRESMLDADQLSAQAHPNITVVAKNFRAQKGSLGTIEANYVADFSFTIRGKTVEKSFPVAITGEGWQTGAPIVIEGLLEAKFEDFGMEPYSAMLGAVGNDPIFHFYFRTRGAWQP